VFLILQSEHDKDDGWFLFSYHVDPSVYVVSGALGAAALAVFLVAARFR
jgi:hypothetical protein